MTERWVCKRETELTCDACESRKPLQPRNPAKFENEIKLWSQVGLDYMDPTLEANKTVAHVPVMVEAASQMAVTAVLFVRADGEHRNVTVTDDEFVRELLFAHNPRLVAICFDPEGGWTSLQILQLDHHIINLAMWRGPSKLGDDLLDNFMKSIQNSVRNKICHVSRVSTLSLTE